MKKLCYLFFVVLILNQASFAEPAIRFCESVLPYKQGFLISNLGSDNLKVRPDEFKGYILYHKNNKLYNFIPADGTLKHPTAMSVYKNRLFVCDADKLWIFNLKNRQEKPAKINFQSDDKSVNDILRIKDELYITVTNTSRIYKINLKDKILVPHKWLDVPTPNGITNYKNTIYVVSIPADYTNATDKNVVYIIKDKNHPVLEKFNNKPALYDGAAVSKNGKILYVSDWGTSSVYAIDIENKKEDIVYQYKNLSPADISLHGDKLLIPDMVNHGVIIYNLKKNKVENP